QNREREASQASLLNRAYQQTAIAAVGQFALVSNDLGPLLNQAVMLIAQTLEVELCMVLELLPDKSAFVLRAGTGWTEGEIGQARFETGNGSQAGFTLLFGEPVVVANLREETRFKSTPLLLGHGAVSGVTVIIQGHQQPFGVLGVHSTKPRAFNEEEVHFL